MKVEKIKQTQIIYNCIQSSYIYDSIKKVNLIKFYHVIIFSISLLIIINILHSKFQLLIYENL